MIRQLTRLGIKKAATLIGGATMAEVRAGQIDVLNETINALNAAITTQQQTIDGLKHANTSLRHQVDQLQAERVTLLKFIKAASADAQGKLPRSLRRALKEIE